MSRPLLHATAPVLTLVVLRAEFPLQWLGECLINQSILYEGNPDATNIKERFLYNFDTPPVVQEQTTQGEVNGMEDAPAPEPQTVTTAPSEPPAGVEQPTTNGEPDMAAEVEQKMEGEKQTSGEASIPDTVMGGTS